MNQGCRVGIVIVTYGHEEVIGELLDNLSQQKESGDKIAVIDNHPEHASAAISEKHSAVDYVVRSANGGFAAGSNQGANLLVDDVDLLLFLNPDTRPAPDVIALMRQAIEAGFDAWMPLLTLPENRVNSTQTIIHTSGLSWCGDYKANISDFTANRKISAISGACMMIRSSTWKEIGGLNEGYFLYYEDTDLSTRLVLKGLKLGLIPQAHVEHDYVFDRGETKWLYIERNRPLYILRTWPTSVILVLLPQLIGVSLGLWLVSITQHRFRLKVRSMGLFFQGLGWALRTRSGIQATRRISGYVFLNILTPSLSTPLLGSISESGAINALFVGYYKLAFGVLRLFR